MPGRPGFTVESAASSSLADRGDHPGRHHPAVAGQFTFVDQSYTTRKAPTWAYVAAIVGFFIVTVFSLFFLLAKENVTVSNVVVGVRGQSGLRRALYVSSGPGTGRVRPRRPRQQLGREFARVGPGRGGRPVSLSCRGCV